MEFSFDKLPIEMQVETMKRMTFSHLASFPVNKELLSIKQEFLEPIWDITNFLMTFNQNTSYFDAIRRYEIKNRIDVTDDDFTLAERTLSRKKVYAEEMTRMKNKLFMKCCQMIDEIKQFYKEITEETTFDDINNFLVDMMSDINKILINNWSTYSDVIFSNVGLALTQYFGEDSALTKKMLRFSPQN